MGVCGHVIGRLCLCYCRNELICRHPDIEINRLGGLEEPVEVLIHESPAAIIKPQPFPHTIAEHEAAVIDTDERLSPRLQRPIEPNQDVRVSRVILDGECEAGCTVVVDGRDDEIVISIDGTPAKPDPEAAVSAG